MRTLLAWLLLLQCVSRCGSWQAILINNGKSTQLWSPFLDPHGVVVDFLLPRYDYGRAARLSNGFVYFVGGYLNTEGTTYIFDPATNATAPGAKLSTPCSSAASSVAAACALSSCTDYGLTSSTAVAKCSFGFNSIPMLQSLL